MAKKDTGDDELYDKEAFSPEKLFNEEEFSTLIVNREGFSKKDQNTADLIETLLEPGHTREEQEAVFEKLKAANAQQMLVDCIASAQKLEEKITLTAACWESGLDFTPQFLDFVTLAMHHDFRLAHEALTVIENNEGNPDDTTLQKAMDIAQTVHPVNRELINELITHLQSRMSSYGK